MLQCAPQIAFVPFIADRMGGKVGHAKYKCFVCSVQVRSAFGSFVITTIMLRWRALCDMMRTGAQWTGRMHQRNSIRQLRTMVCANNVPMLLLQVPDLKSMKDHFESKHPKVCLGSL